MVLVVYAKNAGMRWLFLFTVIIFLSLSCKKKACNPDYNVDIFKTAKQLKDTSIFYGLDSVHTYTEAPGNNLVFNYTFAKGGCGFMTDPPAAQTLNFEINSSLTGFEYKDSSIIATKCYSFLSGEVIYNKPQKISKGIIKGSKLSATKWNIMVQVQPDLGAPVSFNKTFTLSP